MKILSFLNVSNLERISCDSGYNFQRLVIPEFVRAGHKFIFASPVPIEELANTEYKHIPIFLGRHKYEVRFMFPWQEIEKIIYLEDPDVIWVNQSELVPAFRALLTSIASRASLVNYLHYFPYEICHQKTNILLDPSLNLNNNSLVIPLAFLNGVIASDLVLVHSSFAREMLEKGLQTFSLNFPKNSNLAIVPPPFDPELIPSNSIQFEHRRNIVYNHRLYTQYGTQKFIDYLKRGVYVDGHDIVVMDILGERSIERKRLDTSVEIFRETLRYIPKVTIDKGGNDRNYYKNILAQSKFGVAPFRSSCPWSMSVIDCLAAGIPILAQKQAFFPEVVYQECLHDGTYDHFSFIWERLARDKLFWHDCSEAGRHIISSLTPENVTSRLCTLLLKQKI